MLHHFPRKLSLSFVLVACITSLLNASLPFKKPTTGSLQTNFSPTFEPAECMFELPAGIKNGAGIQCGYLDVPEVHANPDGPSIRLAIAIIKSQDQIPKTDPLIMAQGGPGGSTIETYAETLLSKRNFVSNRDIVLFDQRGTKYSTPNLYCSEIDQLIADTIERKTTDAEDEKLT